MMHFSEAFFVHELPWKSLLNVTDSSFQKHLSMGQCVKSSRYLSIIPPVTIECAEVDGDNTSTPIFFEDRYVNRKGKSLENVYAVPVHGEDDVLEHKPLSFGILNQAFNDLSPQVTDSTESGDQDLDTKDVWVDIKTSKENDVMVARVTHAGQDTKVDECKVTEKIGGDEEGIDSVLKGYSANEASPNKKADGSTEATNGTNSKTLLECSVEHLTNSLETLHEVNDTCKDTCTSQDSQEHCGTMQDTIDREVSDVNDIAIIDNTAEKQARKSDVVSVIEPSDGQLASINDPAIATNAQESRANIEGALSEGGKGNASPGNHEDCLQASKDQIQTTDTKSLEDVPEPKVSNCLIPNNNSETTVKKVLGNDSSLESSNGKEVLVLEEGEKTNSSTSLEDMSSNHVRYSPGEATAKKTSSVQYIGCSDTENSSNVAPGNKPSNSSKTGQSDGQDASFKRGEPKPVVGVEKISKEGEPDRAQSTSTGKDKANSTSELCNSPDETTSLNEKINETEANIKEPGCNHIGDSSAKQALGTGVTNNSNLPPTDSSLKSGDSTRSTKGNSDKSSKVRNTAQVNPGKRVSNSIFYEGTNFEENGSEQSLQNEDVSNTQLDTIRLTPNSSTDVIGCFCAGKLAKTSSPYRPTSESDASNIMLHKAKHDVLSQMNYCGTLYSDSTTEFLVQPYFMNPKPDLSMEPVHFVVCVHGLDGNSGDLRLLRCFLEMALPSTKFEFLMSEVNQDNTFVTFEKQTDKLVSEILHHMEAYRISPTRISFIGHSLGNIIIRSALNHPLLEPYVELFHTFLSLSGPHLGMVHHTSSLVSTGMWLLQKWKKSDSLLQLSLNDSTDMRDTFIYKLSKKKGLEYFTNVLLVSSVQDHYAPFHSSRIELPKSLRSNSQEYIVYREMMENLLTPLLNQPNRSLVRYSVYHCLPSSTNTFIGRAAHIAMLDSELFIEKLICTSAAKYFQ
ncbi:FAM135B-like isoform X1 [Paramuricea clavata]|uniref:FAM135B-like isoform X1 n=1 Tax=Paramuricea clavata TaxID=317549 RepID=A0A6S7KIW7_PARCT|nr:FAM135B-like isoform X1 [Paramuricea clavata]